jgi:hypothetical protein
MENANKPWLAYDTTFEGKTALMRVDMRRTTPSEGRSCPF